MIELILSGRLEEDNAAREIYESFIYEDGEILTNSQVEILILSSVQCYGQSPKDIDIVILYKDRRSKTHVSSNGTELKSAIVTVEVKGHRPSDVKFEGSNCFVRYRGTWHSASHQSDGQYLSLKNYLENNKIIKAPYINNLIWLKGVPESLLPTSTNNLVGSKFGVNEFVESVSNLTPGDRSEIDALSDERRLRQIKQILSAKVSPGFLDRKKVEAISQKASFSGAQYFKKLGEQLLIFRGRGGTGKTIRLLQIAKHLYEHEGQRVLLLTYNRALAAEIQRLLCFLGVVDGAGEPAIRIKTLHQLMRSWLIAFQLVEGGDLDWLDKFGNLKTELLAMLSGGAISDLDIAEIKSFLSGDLTWDAILVDECQDWPENEVSILYALYHHKSFVLADGLDQLVRSQGKSDWRDQITKTETQVVPLRKSLRLKASLCQAVSAVANELGINSWDLEPEPEMYGGKILVLPHNAYDMAFHSSLVLEARKNGNEILDLLFCVPPGLVTTFETGRRESWFANQFSSWGMEFWDGVDDYTRRSFATSLNHHRIVQYESCRGLEGWTVVCAELDEFFNSKIRQFAGPTEKDMFTPMEVLQHRFAAQWIMIPLTRALDSLVITLRSDIGPVGQALKSASEMYPEIIDWRF